MKKKVSKISKISESDKYDIDLHEAALFEQTYFDEIITGKVDQKRQKHKDYPPSRGLIAKIKYSPLLDFKVSDYSLYKDNVWVLSKTRNMTWQKCNFNSTMPGSNELKKIIAYHCMPDYHPWGTIRSYTTTARMSRTHIYIEKYLCKPNAINLSPNNINAISLPMINRALDEAKGTGLHSIYSGLYNYIKFWITLSGMGLVPNEYCLNVPLNLIDTTERAKDVWNFTVENCQGWKPFSQDEIATLVNYALFWTEKAMPIMLQIKKFIIDNGRDKSATQIAKHHQWPEFEKALGQKVEGITVCGYGLTHHINNCIKILKNGPKKYPKKLWVYTWVDRYRTAIDHIRNGILILTALVTGMRLSELAGLTFDDIYKDKTGNWHINITRYKTSNDPNFFGETKEIPLPSYIGRKINEYKELRDMKKYMKKKLVFQSIKTSWKVNFYDRMIKRAIFIISNMLNIDGMHVHRFRKTIAEILIHRSEKNIDIIRLLFGHKSYQMTLRYIARNPFMVESIIESLTEISSANFANIIKAVKDGSHSGAAGDRIAENVSLERKNFKGRILRKSLLEHIRLTIEHGTPLLIQRTNLSSYCVNSGCYTVDNPPPCLTGRKIIGDKPIPDPSNCQLECNNNVLLGDAEETLKGNIKFYKTVLDDPNLLPNNKAVKQITQKLQLNEMHLYNLNKDKAPALHDNFRI